MSNFLKIRKEVLIAMKYRNIMIIIFLLFTGMMIFSFSASAEQETAEQETAEQEIVELIPSETIERALEHSIDLKIARLELENAEIEYEKTQAEELSTQSRYDELQAELQMDQARESFQGQKRGTIISITEMYLEILTSREEIEILEKQKQLQKRQLEVTEAQYEAGYTGRMSLAGAEHAYENAQIELEYSRRELEHKIQEFRDEIGLIDDVDFKLAEVEQPAVMDYSREETVNMILENDFSLEVDQRQVELNEVSLERARVSGVSRLDEKQLENNLELANLNLEQNTRRIKNQARSQFNSFQRTAEQMRMSEKSLEQEQENFKITEEQYRAGTRTENELLSAEIDLLEAENRLNGAIINYLISELNLMQSMGLDLGRVYDEQLK